MQQYKIRFWIEWGREALFWAADCETCAAFGDPDVSLIWTERLPFSARTLARIREIDGWYQMRLNWDDPAAPLFWRQEECDRFNAAIASLMETMRAELGDRYELINAQEPAAEDPDLEAYLLDPEGFRRRQCGMA